MQAKRRTIRLPNFEACSLALIAFAAMINATPVRSQTVPPAPAPSVSFGPGPTVSSTPAKTTATQVATPPKSAASGTKAKR